MSSNIIYICFKSTGEPYITSNSVAGGGCIQTTTVNREYQSVYLYYRNIYLANVQKQYEDQKFRDNLFYYNRFYSIAAYGQPSASKRIIGPICPGIYNFRKTF